MVIHFKRIPQMTTILKNITKMRVLVLGICITAYMTIFQKQQHLLGATKSEMSKKYVVEKITSKHPECQLIYVVGIEGSVHHGFMPVLENFVQEQRDESGHSFSLYARNKIVRQIMNFTDPNVRRVIGQREDRKEVMKTICPSDGRNTVIIEDMSFPTDKLYRKKFRNMTPAEIAADLKVNPNPISLVDLPQSFEPFADVYYVLLHRQWLNTVASHPEFDGGYADHGRIMSGYLQYLGDLFSNNGIVKAVPTKVVCADFLGRREYQEKVLEELATEFQWEKKTCSNCFHKWKTSTKNPEIDLQSIKYLLEVQPNASSFWPPRDIEFVCPL